MDFWEAKEGDGNNLREPRYDVLSSFFKYGLLGVRVNGAI
jgi:hypothetical protein